MDRYKPTAEQEEYYISSVKVDRKSNKEYFITITQFDEPLVVHEDLFISYRLMKGQCLTSPLIDEIKEENAKYMAYIKAIKYLGSKARSTKQISEYLKRQQFQDEHISNAVERLKADGYVDDEQYALAYVQSKSRIQGKGRNRIALDLKARGVAQNAIEAALESLDEEEEYEAACKAAMKKLRSLSNDEHEIRRKLQQFLLRKGFSGVIIRKVMVFVENERKISLEQDIYGELLDN